MPHGDEFDALSATPVVLGALLANRSPSRPAGDEGWTAPEIVAHLRDCEEIRINRLRQMRDEHEPLIRTFDQEALAQERNYAATDIAEALADFARLRTETLALLSPLTESAWERSGIREEGGSISIESLARHTISHDLAHLRQISESLTMA